MVDQPAPDTPRLLPRRSLMAAGAAAAAGLVLAACSSSDDQPSSAGSTPSGPKLSPDVAVATAALGEIRAVAHAVQATLARYPENRAPLADFQRLHRVHEASLVDAVPGQANTSASPAPYVVPRRRDVALRRLQAREQRLHDSLDGLAMRAQSGQFARLLGSMGAALSQRLSEWPAA